MIQSEYLDNKLSIFQMVLQAEGLNKVMIK